MIQITGWNCMSGLCTCEMKENIFLILLFGQYDIDTFEHIGTVNSMRNGLLEIDSCNRRMSSLSTRDVSLVRPVFHRS